MHLTTKLIEFGNPDLAFHVADNQLSEFLDTVLTSDGPKSGQLLVCVLGSAAIRQALTEHRHLVDLTVADLKLTEPLDTEIKVTAFDYVSEGIAFARTGFDHFIFVAVNALQAKKLDRWISIQVPKYALNQKSLNLTFCLITSPTNASLVDKCKSIYETTVDIKS